MNADAPNAFYLTSRPIKKTPAVPTLRKQSFPHCIPEYKQRDITTVVDKCGIEILNLITCNVLRQKVARGMSAQELKDRCIANDIWTSHFRHKRIYPKVTYAELLMTV